MPLSDRLKTARTRLDLTQSQVAERTLIGATTISEFENGAREPSISQLARLASAYRRSVEYFLSEQVPTAEIVLWRAKPSSPTADELHCQLLTLANQFHRLEILCDENQAHELLRCDVRRQDFTAADAVKLAYDFRKAHGLGDRPGSALLRTLEEDCKVKVFHISFQPVGSAACTIHPESGASVLLNANHSSTQRNSDLAHELFHLLTWAVFRSEGGATDNEASEDEEVFANLFAGALLIPDEALKSAVGSTRRNSLRVDDFFDLARQFDVPVDMLLRRLQSVYRIAQNKIDATIEVAKAHAAQWASREIEATPPERPARFRSLADRAFRRAMISTGTYADFVGISRRQAMRLQEQEPGTDAEVEVVNS